MSSNEEGSDVQAGSESGSDSGYVLASLTLIGSLLPRRLPTSGTSSFPLFSFADLFSFGALVHQTALFLDRHVIWSLITRRDVSPKRATKKKAPVDSDSDDVSSEESDEEPE